MSTRRPEPQDRQTGRDTPFFTADDIRGRLHTRHLAKQIFVFKKLGSTNEYARRLVRAQRNLAALVVADQQTRGRGRLRRSWYSPPGLGLWASLTLPPDLPSERLGVLSLLASLAVAGAIEEVTALVPTLKWPNDVLLEGRKVAGVLLESEFSGTRLTASVAGIGVNVNHHASDFPPELRDNAASLAMVSQASVDRLQLLLEVVHLFDRAYERLRQGQVLALVNEWKRRCPFLGQGIRLQLENSTVTGVFEDVGENGHLMLRLPDGTLRGFTAGECSLWLGE